MCAQLCLTLCSPIDCMQPTRLLVHGLFQAKLLQWIVISLSKGSSQLRVETQRSNPCLLHCQADSLPLSTREILQAITIIQCSPTDLCKIIIHRKQQLERFILGNSSQSNFFEIQRKFYRLLQLICKYDLSQISFFTVF